MKNQKISRRALALLAALAVFAASMLVLSATLTSGFTVETRAVNWVTDEGVNLSATLFVPSNATAETPAAGVLVCPGGNTPHTFYASYSLELARRGYVVLAYDYYGTMSSDFSAEGSSGAVAAMKYLTSLSFVDTNRLAATGHSNGGGQASAAITSEYAASAASRSVLFIGCGVASEDPTVYEGINVGAIWGLLDECGQGTFWDVVHEDALNYGAMPALAGVTNEEFVPGQWYGDAADGSARVLYTPNTFHSLSNIMPGSVTDILTYIDTTVGGNVSGLAPSSHIYLWQELAVLVAAISLCVMLFPVGSLLLDTKFFAPLCRPVPAATSRGDAKFWIFLLVPGILSALIVKTTIMQGQTILGMAPNLFPVQSTNGFVWWFFLSALIGTAFFLVRMAVDKTMDRSAALARLRTTPADLGRAVLFGLAAVALPYACAVVGERTVGWYGRIFQTYFASVSANRLVSYVVYFVIFAVLFTVYAFIQAEGLRLRSGNETVNYLITLLANALPAALFLGALYGKLILTHVTPITGREMSRAQGAMMGMLLLYFVIAKVVTYFYKKTGNIYVVAMTNAAFITWLSVNTQQLVV